MLFSITFLILIFKISQSMLIRPVDINGETLKQFLIDFSVYTKSSAVYSISKCKEDNNGCIIKSIGSAGLWGSELTEKQFHAPKIMADHSSFNRLILLYGNFNDTMKILEKIQSNSSTNERIIIVNFYNEENELLYYKTVNILPSSKLFLVNTHKWTVRYVYRDYIKNASKLKNIGKWISPRRFKYNQKFEDCCYDLRGYELNIVYVTDGMPYSEVKKISNEKYIFSGIIGNIFDILVKVYKLKIKKVYSISDYGEFYAGTNGTGVFNEFFHKRADVAIAGFLYTETRNNGAEFSIPIVKSYITATYKYIPNLQRWKMYFQPFDFEAWMLIMLSTIALFLIFNVMKLMLKVKKIANMIDVWAEIMNQGVDITSGSVGWMAVNLNFMTFGLLLSMFYGTKIISQKAVFVFKEPFKTFHELSHSKTYTPIIQEGTAPTFILRDSAYEEYHNVWNILSKDLKNNMVKTAPEAMARVNSGGYAHINDYLTLAYYKKNYSSIRIMNSKYMESGIYMIFRKELPIFKILNKRILNLKESGIIQRISNEFHIHKDRVKEIPLEQITIDYIYIPLAVLFLMLIVSFVILLIEKRQSSTT